MIHANNKRTMPFVSRLIGTIYMTFFSNPYRSIGPRAILLFLISLIPIFSLFSQNQKIRPEFQKVKLKPDSWLRDNFHELVKMEFRVNEEVITAMQKDSSHWDLTGNGKTGSVQIVKDNESGPQWIFTWDGKTFSLIISDYGGDLHDPRLMHISIADTIWYLHNFEPDMNSVWGMTLQEDFERESDLFMIMEVSNWKDASFRFNWNVSIKKKGVPAEVQLASIFACLLANNVRYREDISRN
jgi:hypothetical protein